MLKQWRKAAVAVFIMFEILWFMLYHAGVFSADKDVAKNIGFIAILVCFIFCSGCFVLGKNRSRSDILLCIALFFTCIADIFLVVLRGEGFYAEIGVLFFVVVQAVYFVKIHFFMGHRDRLRKARFSEVQISLCARIIMYLAAAGLAFFMLWGSPLLSESTALILISLFYFANSAVNIIFAVCKFSNNPLIALGLVLLLICDLTLTLVFVGINIRIGILSNIHVQWLFYMPSQALLALAILPCFQRQNRPNQDELVLD